MLRMEFFVDLTHKSDTVLRADNLACRRGLRPVYQGLTLALASGEALALYGANGSGKTSLLRQLAGFLALDAGRLSDLPPRHYLGHADGLKAAMRVDEALAFEARLQGGAATAKTHKAADLLSMVGLGGRAAQAVGDLSAGQRRRLALARLIVAPRPLWLLDEPLTALDAAGSDLVSALAQAHLSCGGMIVAASHQPLDFATQQLNMTDFTADFTADFAADFAAKPAEPVS